MGLYLLLAEPVEWERLYNCSFYSVDSIPLAERKRVVFAVIVFSLFILYELLYIPCLYAMCRKSLRSVFCYKLMIEMAIFDMLSLPLTALVPAIYTYNGLMYCSAPKLTFVFGSFMFALWIGYSMTSLILAINRCLAITNKYGKIFEGKWIQIGWLSAAPTASILILFFGQSITFNSKLGAWFFNPHLEYFDNETTKYNSDFQVVNNIVFSTFLPIIYVFFFWRNRSHLKVGMRGPSKGEIQLFIQTFIINVTIAMAAAGYMIMQYLPVPQYWIAFSHVGWIIVEGAPPVVYLTMNKAIRRILRRQSPSSNVGQQQPQSHPSLSADKNHYPSSGQEGPTSEQG